MGERDAGYDDSILSLLFENIYVRVGLVVIYVIVFGLSVIGMLGVILVEKFHWKTPILVKFCRGDGIFASFTVSLFCIMQNLTFDFLENYQIIELLQRGPPEPFWMSRDSQTPRR